MSNTDLWDKLGKTDPEHTKSFRRAGGFSGTAIKPMWAYKRMTEEFGPCGKGWGVYEPSFQVVPGPEGEMLVFCTASIWYEKPEQRAFGVGGDKAVGKNKHGLSSDDEAFKKAFTDAITNALKMIGVGADVHMGMFDDNKYVNTLRDEFAQANTKSSAALKRENSWEKVMEQFNSDLVDCKTLVALETLKATYRAKAKSEGWTAAWMNALKDEFLKAEDAIMNAMEKEEAA